MKTLEQISKLLLAVGLSLLTFIGCSTILNKLDDYQTVETTKNLPKFNLTQNYEEHQEIIPLVRIHKNGQFTCSGTVISNDYVLTAAHCLVTESFLNGYPKMDREAFEIVSIPVGEQKSFTVKAYAAGVNKRADYALLRGDFSKFSKSRLNVSNKFMFEIQGPLVACGFPWGTNYICYPVGSVDRYTFMLQANVFAFPGMSGGPLVDTSNGEIIGINSRLLEKGLVVAPVIGLFETLGVEVVK